MASSIALAVAVPAYYYFPTVADYLILAALPPHIYMGMTRVIGDYLPDWPAEGISFVIAFLIFYAMCVLLKNGSSLAKVIVDLWRQEIWIRDRSWGRK